MSALPADLVAVGRVLDAYGVRGWVKIEPYNAPDDSVLRHCRRWWLADGRSIEVERARVHGATVVGKPAGSHDRDSALALKGLELRVSRAEFPQAGPGEYYWVDLLGAEVVNLAGVVLGRVAEVVDHGAHPILVVQGETGGECLIPFVEAFVSEVDLQARRIVADWQPD